MRLPWAVGILFLVPGCVLEEAGDRTEARTATKDGIVLSGNVATTGHAHHLFARAHNQGSQTFKISSICMPNFFQEVRRDGARVWPEQQAYCMAYGVKDFGPGESLELAEDWDKHTVDDEGTTRDARPGAHEWYVGFHYGKDSPDQRLEILVPVQVTS